MDNTKKRKVIMKNRGFTLIEVSILFVIFLIVAFLVAPLSMDDTVQANFNSRWKNVQSDFCSLIDFSLQNGSNLSA